MEGLSGHMTHRLVERVFETVFCHGTPTVRQCQVLLKGRRPRYENNSFFMENAQVVLNKCSL